ncbi:multidrug effflux MFS transporter [Microbacterium horticulturae]|uniref:Multidrug effflux MFS transporter n=1 Tax=Microbacterium horticulturae TaxID=3028316 RepID=A0ABY8BWA9_9MICO|nr:multidrug effflux MFS transporter [Microbacterium sp. KACC 23027]WEG08485.1 multidrug effflux MFS transporter [Microbacterium sp. KACC 23027]
MVESSDRSVGRGIAGSSLAALGMLTILGPLGTDTFLPALPAMADDFGVAVSAVQLALTGFTVGMAVGQLVAGPLSDTIGRRAPLLAGSSLMAVAAGLGSTVPSVPLLVAACIVMGLAGSVGLSVARAVVSDLATGAVLTRGYAILGTMMSLGPIIGPVLGVTLLWVGGWRAIFLGLAVFAVLCTALLVAWVPESHPPQHRLPADVRVILRVAVQAFRSRHFLCGAMTVWFSFFALFAYVGGSPFVVQSVLGFSSAGYAAVFMAGGVGLVICSLLAAKLAGRFSQRRLIGIGLIIQALGASLIGVAALVGASPWLLLPGMILVNSPMGFVIGPAIAYAVHDLRHASGTSIAILQAVQWLVAGLAPPLVALGGTMTIAPFAIVIAVGVSLASLSWWLLRPKRVSVS